MKKIAFFCIPAHGHTNPMLPVASELVRRGDQVRFYSFDMFREKIEATGAQFVSCDAYLPELTSREAAQLKKVSTTEMSIQDLRITLNMDAFLDEEFRAFQPDVVYTDSVCFWGKLNAWKHEVPMVVSTSTFAFNQLSSQYMKHSPAEMADLILGLPRTNRELKKLRPYGYRVKGILSLVQSDNQTDSVVYTTRRFQPYGESFSQHYAFVGPSVFSTLQPDKNKDRPLIYISLGTVINERPDFYHKCMEALKSLSADVIISCGQAMRVEQLGALPENVSVYPTVDQLEVLSRASAFITHCGMNSVSESLYMATPMVLYPQTGEQQAVARRAQEIGAGTWLRDDSVEGIRRAVEEILNQASYAKAAEECSREFRSHAGAKAAADFIEGAPHQVEENDLIAHLNRLSTVGQIIVRLFVVALAILAGFGLGAKYGWMVGIAGGFLCEPVNKWIQSRVYARLTKQK